MRRGWRKAALVVLLAWGAGLTAAGAQTPLPAPGSVQIANDEMARAGDGVLLTWEPPAAEEIPAEYRLAGYRVYLGETAEELVPAGLAEGAEQSASPQSGLREGREYWGQVGAVYVPAGETVVFSPEDPTQVITPGVREVKAGVVGPATTVGQWFNPGYLNVLIFTAIFCSVTLVVLYVARRRDIYIRPIAGLQAVDDAIGRATEMGRPILYITGLGGASDIATIASMLVLGHLAHKTAPYGTRLMVPAADSMVMTTEREIVSQAYLHAGRPELFNAEDIFYVTDSQFGYVTAVAGIMVRERPAVNFFMGYFAAESLMLAETGNLVDALQIAGTDSDTQLPFFITACDYTLMGEELYAASAYLSRNPILVAQLKAQDLGKIALVALLVAGIVMGLVVAPTAPELAERFLAIFKT